MHPSIAEKLEEFEFSHLPPHLQRASMLCHDLAHAMARTYEGTQVTIGLQKLLEAKDCFVRAAKKGPKAPIVHGEGSCR